MQQLQERLLLGMQLYRGALILRSSYDGCCDAILLDTAVKGSNSGGTGASFDWTVAKHCQEQWGIPVPWAV